MRAHLPQHVRPATLQAAGEEQPWPDGRSSRPPVESTQCVQRRHVRGVEQRPHRRGHARAPIGPLDAIRDDLAPGRCAGCDERWRDQAPADHRRAACARPSSASTSSARRVTASRATATAWSRAAASRIRPRTTATGCARRATQHFYAVITNGYGVMYSYATRVAPADRLAIVAYIRALQLSQHAPLGSLADEDRTRLDARRRRRRREQPDERLHRAEPRIASRAASLLARVPRRRASRVVGALRCSRASSARRWSRRSSISPGSSHGSSCSASRWPGMMDVMIHELTGGEWGWVVRRPLEAAMLTLPLLACSRCRSPSDCTSLFPWARPDALDAEPAAAGEGVVSEPCVLRACAMRCSSSCGAASHSMLRRRLDRSHGARRTRGPPHRRRRAARLSGDGHLRGVRLDRVARAGMVVDRDSAFGWAPRSSWRAFGFAIGSRFSCSVATGDDRPMRTARDCGRISAT